MNGIHDMGGMKDMGPVQYEKDEPVFHVDWEGRVYAINASLRAIGEWNLDAWRYQIELLPPADYLRMTYYERWLGINEQLLVKHGLVTAEELTLGKPKCSPVESEPCIDGPGIPASHVTRGVPSSHDPKVLPHFKLGKACAPATQTPQDTLDCHVMREAKWVRSRATTGSTVSRYQRAFSGRKAPARILRSLPSAGTLGRAGISQRLRFLDMWDDYLEHA